VVLHELGHTLGNGCDKRKAAHAVRRTGEGGFSYARGGEGEVCPIANVHRLA